MLNRTFWSFSFYGKSHPFIIHVCIMASGVFLICSLLGLSLNSKLTCLAGLTDQNLQEFTSLPPRAGVTDLCCTWLGIWTQILMVVKQALYHPPQSSPSPCCRILETFLSVCFVFAQGPSIQIYEAVGPFLFKPPNPAYHCSRSFFPLKLGF